MKILYVAATLTKESQLKLYEAINEIKPIPRDWRVYCHHMTIHFNPRLEQGVRIPSCDIPVSLEVIGYAFDEKGIAVRVEPTPSRTELLMQGQSPHITVATAPGIKPFYSNELLDKQRGVPLKEKFILEGFVWKKWANGSSSRDDLAYEELRR